MTMWLTLGMELCWVALLTGLAWTTVAGGTWHSGTLLVVPGVVGAVGALLTSNIWYRERWYDAFRWAVAVICGAMTAQLGRFIDDPMRAQVGAWLAFIVAIVLFWRGWYIGEESPGARAAEQSFQTGSIAVLPLLTLVHFASPNSGLLPGVAFLAFGLVAVGLARREDRAVRRAGLEIDWLILGTALVILAIGAMVVMVLILSPALLLEIGRAIIAAIAWFFDQMRGLMSAEPITTDLAIPTPPPFQVPRVDPVTNERIDFPGFLLVLLEWIGMLALAVVLVLVILRLMRGAMALAMAGGESKASDDEARPRAQTVGMAWTAWWRELLRNLFGWWRATSAPGVHRQQATATAQRPPNPTVIRHYLSFLDAVRRVGLARRSNETPGELADRLAGRLPGADRDVAELTALFNASRYGGAEPDRRTLGRMRDAVERVAEVVRTLREGPVRR
jgi:hypothetical protein